MEAVGAGSGENAGGAPVTSKQDATGAPSHALTGKCPRCQGPLRATVPCVPNAAQRHGLRLTCPHCGAGVQTAIACTVSAPAEPMGEWFRREIDRMFGDLTGGKAAR